MRDFATAARWSFRWRERCVLGRCECEIFASFWCFESFDLATESELLCWGWVCHVATNSICPDARANHSRKLHHNNSLTECDWPAGRHWQVQSWQKSVSIKCEPAPRCCRTIEERALTRLNLRGFL
jgi:hypothetical protein